MYSELFKLSEPPFRLTPDPQFLFPSKQHSRAKAYMESTIWLADGFVVITGEIGAGKTTLIESFLENLPSEVILAHISQTQLTPVEFLQAVLAEFGFEEYHERKVELLTKLKHYMVEQYARGRTLLLIVDEAQNLSHKVLEEIRMLSGIESHKEKPLRIILAGQPELADKLDSMRLEQLRQRIRLRFHLSTLTKRESAAYIQHRLNVAGAEGRKIFDKDSMDLVFRYTGGVPRLINVLCDTAMLCAFSEEKQTIDVGLINEAINELQWVEYAKRNENRGRYSASNAKRAPRIRLFDSADDEPSGTATTELDDTGTVEATDGPDMDIAVDADATGSVAVDATSTRAALESSEATADTDTRESAVTDDTGITGAIETADTPDAKDAGASDESAAEIDAAEVLDTRADAASVDTEAETGTLKSGSEASISAAASALEAPAESETLAREFLQKTPARFDILFKDQHLTEFDLPLGLTVVGRTGDNDLQIRSRFISRHHIQISTNEKCCIAVDLKSTNGMFIESKRVKKHTLKDGDVIQLGEHKLVYKDLRNASKSDILRLVRETSDRAVRDVANNDSTEFEGLATEVYESKRT